MSKVIEIVSNNADVSSEEIWIGNRKFHLTKPIVKSESHFKKWSTNYPFYENVDVFGYIEKCYGIFHCEGDEVILEDITEFLEGKGMKINA